jgi:hypothetical protein
VRCWFEGNSSACNGGGLMAYSQTTLTLRESDFEGNEAQYGGGAYVWSDERGLTVEDCAFAGNAASYYGGGLYLRNAPATGRVERCAFLGNLAERDGGGAYNLSGNLFFINCLFSGNQAEGTGGTGGGALVNYSGANPRLMHCTFAGNEGKNGGGMAGLGSGGVNAGLTNCVFWGNLATNYGSQIYQNVTGTLRIAYSDIEDGTNGIYLTGNAALSQGSGVITNDPLFMDPAGEDGIAGTWDDDLHLGWGSPCVDSGTANGAPAVDLENVSRPQMNGYDMGALEREADADHDDLPDTWEMEHFGDFDETGTGDADSDGLSNLGEYEHGTDPLDWDSDGDQASDGDEVAAGTDPLNPAEFPDSDADGLPDPWETLHFGSLSQTGASDPDEDGFCNGYEYRYGSDPTSGASIPTGANPDWGQSSRLVGRQPHAALHQLGHGGDQHSGGAHRGHGRLRPHRGG